MVPGGNRKMRSKITTTPVLLPWSLRVAHNLLLLISLRIFYTLSCIIYKILTYSVAILYRKKRYKMNLAVLAVTKTSGMNLSTGYFIGLIISIFILCYLIYSLVKPEKF